MEGVAADPVLVYADQNGIAWIDKRHQNGCLWLIGDMSIYPHTIKLHQMGYDFKYAKGGAKATDGRPGWYLQKKPQLVVESPLQPMEAPKAVNPENSISPELFALLAEDEYAPLLECLLQQGITTVEQFEKINPWAFMNRYGLYSIGQRQAIYKQIISRLKPIKQSAPEQLYILQTKATSYQGNSPAESFAAFCENIAQKYPLKIRSLLDMPYNGKGSIVLSRTPSSSDCAKLMNPVAYITGSLTAQAAVVYGQWICKMCNEPDCPVSMSEPQKAQSAVQQPIANTVQPKLESEQHQNAPKETKPPQQTEPSQHFELPKRPDVSAPPKQLGTLSQPTTPRSPEVPKQSDVSVPPQQPEAASQPEITPTSQPEAKTFVPANAFLTERAEKIVLAADIDGISMENLYSQLRTTMIATKQAVADSPRIVSVAGKLIHEDAFVDWEDGANQMEKILDKLLAKNNGYVSAAQLYEYVHADMQMFLNDNNMDDTRAVYDLAQHLFEKVDYHGKHLVFQSKTHISRGETAVTTNLDIMRNFAREQGGFFVEDELEECDIISEGMDIHHRFANRQEREEKISEMLKKVGLSPEHAARYPHQFSGGQRQRVGIARALIMNPKLIIADECISALDVSIQAQVVNLMKDIQAETQCAYLFIAHDLSMVKYISDRIGVLHLGYMVESGTKEEIFSHPVHPYTKSLLSAIPHPNPVVEKHRVALTYNYATSGIDYAKGTEHSVGGTHTVLATDEEFDAWTK